MALLDQEHLVLQTSINLVVLVVLMSVTVEVLAAPVVLALETLRPVAQAQVDIPAMAVMAAALEEEQFLPAVVAVVAVVVMVAATVLVHQTQLQVVVSVY